MFFAAHYLTVADLVMFANFYAYMDVLTKKQRFEVCNISRWYDLLQHTPKVTLGQPLIDIDLDEVAAPVPQPKKEDGKGKEKEKQAAPAAAAAPADKDKEAEGKKEKAKEKSKEKADKPKAEKPAEEPKVEGPDVAKLRLMVGKILQVERHKEADLLYVEQVDMGEEKPRTVVSGLVKSMQPEEMLNQMVVLVANLEATKIRGVKSEAMVLCATSVDGTKTEFVQPPPGTAPGERVFIEGLEGEPLKKATKDVFGSVQPDFKTSEERVATYKGHDFRTKDGVCSVKSVVGGSIK